MPARADAGPDWLQIDCAGGGAAALEGLLFLELGGMGNQLLPLPLDIGIADTMRCVGRSAF